MQNNTAASNSLQNQTAKRTTERWQSMFLVALSKMERSAFVRLAEIIIKADGITHREEAALLDLMKIEMDGTNGPGEFAEADLETAAKAFETRESRVACIFELIGLSMSDGQYHINERNTVKTIAELFRFSDQELSAMEDWVERQLSLAAEARQMISGGS